MALNNKKIIISVKVNQVDLTSLANYSPFGDPKCFEVYKYLIKKNIDVFKNDSFITYLKTISTKYDGSQVSLFDSLNSLDYGTVFEDENFIGWIKTKKNKIGFIDKLLLTNDKYFIRKHKTEEIHVVPVLNEDFNDENVKYTDALITALKKKGDDLWLLLHDEDLYDSNSNYPYHKADISEFHQGHVVNNCNKLKKLIINNKVFTFIHQDSDSFFSEVIKKLDELTLDDIIKELEKHKRVDFAKKIAKCIKKGDMTSVLKKARETYDFSEQFLEL